MTSNKHFLDLLQRFCNKGWVRAAAGALRSAANSAGTTGTILTRGGVPGAFLKLAKAISSIKGGDLVDVAHGLAAGAMLAQS